MQLFLIILAIVISIIIIAMVVYGIYFIIASFQLAHIRLDIQDLWGICSYAYCFMDENDKAIFAKRLKNELHRSIQEVGNDENKVEAFRIARLKQVKNDAIELYKELSKRIEKSVPLAREVANEEVHEIKNVVNILKDVLGEN